MFTYTESITQVQSPNNEHTFPLQLNQPPIQERQIYEQSITDRLYVDQNMITSDYMFEEEVNKHKVQQNGQERYSQMEQQNEELRRHLGKTRQQGYQLSLKLEEQQKKINEQKELMRKMAESLKQNKKKAKNYEQQKNQANQRLRRVQRKIKQDLQLIYEQQIKKLQLQLVIEKETFSKERKELQTLRKTTKIQKSKKEQQNPQIKQLLQEIKNVNQQNLLLIKLKEELTQQIRKHQQELKNNKGKLQKLTKAKQDLENECKALKRAKQAFQSQLNQLTKTHQQQTKKWSIEREVFIKSIQKTNKQIANLKKSLQQKQNEYKTLEQQRQKLQKKLQQQRQDNKDELIRMQEQLQSCHEDNHKFGKYMKIIQQQIFYMEQTVGIKQIKRKEFKQWQQIEKNIQILEQINKNIISLRYFSDSQILDNKRQFLIYELQKFIKNPSFTSSLIYRFDPLNQTNFHKYFDHKQSLLVLVHLKNGAVIGGYTSFAFNETHVQKPGKGLLFSVTNQKSYKIRQNPKLPVTQYDEYYFILGNSQIRLRTQQQKVFSNFGIANSTFDNQGEPRTKFLNTTAMNDNELDIQTYEFYQIKFSQ